MRTASNRGRHCAPVAAFAVACAVALLASACSDNDGKDTTPTPPPTTVTGTAAMGLPLGGVTVTLKDGSGKSATARTASDGRFSIVTSGMAPPYLLQVPAGNVNLYSVSADALASTTVNVTTLSDLVARTWFTLHGNAAIDAVFQNPVGTTLPPPSQVAAVEGVFDDVFRVWLIDAGIDPAKTSLIATPFTADGSGMDLVLEETSIQGNVITITGVLPPTTTAGKGSAPIRYAPAAQRTQVSTLDIDSSSGTVTVESTVEAAGVVTESVVTAVVPTASPMEDAIAAINANLKAFADTLNTRRQALTVEDVLQYLDPDYLHGGGNGQQMAELVVAQWRLFPATATESMYLHSLDQLDLVNGTAHGWWVSSESDSGSTNSNRMESRFRRVDGVWLMSGDGRVAELTVRMITGHEIHSGGSVWSGQELGVRSESPHGTIAGVGVTGGPWSDAALACCETDEDEAGHLIDTADLYRELLPGEIPPAGTPFTLTVRPVSGPAQAYTLPMSTSSTDGLRFVATLGGLDQVVGRTVTLEWTQPVTHDVFELQLYFSSFGASGVECETQVWGIGADATSRQVTVPATCEGEPVVRVQFELAEDGVHDEHSFSAYYIQ
jgi:hypothetical protein